MESENDFGRTRAVPGRRGNRLGARRVPARLSRDRGGDHAGRRLVPEQLSRDAEDRNSEPGMSQQQLCGGGEGAGMPDRRMRGEMPGWPELSRSQRAYRRPTWQKRCLPHRQLRLIYFLEAKEEFAAGDARAVIVGRP